jgi:hypothetical protein
MPDNLLKKIKVIFLQRMHFSIAGKSFRFQTTSHSETLHAEKLLCTIHLLFNYSVNPPFFQAVVFKLLFLYDEMVKKI